MQTIRFSGRKSSPATIEIGQETDGNAEVLRFLLPTIADGQIATLQMILPDGTADVLNITDGQTVIPARIMEISGTARAWVEILAGDVTAWHSEMIYMGIGELPEISDRTEQQYPTALQDAIIRSETAKAIAEAAAAYAAASSGQANFSLSDAGHLIVTWTDTDGQSHDTDIGEVSAYAVAVRNGFTGTEAEWEQYISTASINAAAAAADALKAEGYAVGKQDGTDVGSGSAYYHNNAKYYNEQAQSAKTAAQEAAATASAAYGTDLLAADYDAETGATAGNYYIYSGDLYLCTADTTGAWDGTKFTKVNVGGQLGDLKSALSGGQPKKEVSGFGEVDITDAVEENADEVIINGYTDILFVAETDYSSTQDLTLYQNYGFNICHNPTVTIKDKNNETISSLSFTTDLLDIKTIYSNGDIHSHYTDKIKINKAGQATIIKEIGKITPAELAAAGTVTYKYNYNSRGYSYLQIGNSHSAWATYRNDPIDAAGYPSRPGVVCSIVPPGGRGTDVSFVNVTNSSGSSKTLKLQIDNQYLPASVDSDATLKTWFESQNDIFIYLPLITPTETVLEGTFDVEIEDELTAIVCSDSRIKIDVKYNNLVNESIAETNEEIENIQIAPKNTTFFHVSKNMVNPNDIIIGSGINNTTGKFTTLPASARTAFVQVKPQTTYVIRRRTAEITPSYCFYNFAKQRLSGGTLSAGNDMLITSPANAAYLVATCGGKSALDEFMIAEYVNEDKSFDYYGDVHIKDEYIPVGDPDSIVLNLPEKVYALVGYELNIYFDNITEDADKYIWQVVCVKSNGGSFGQQLERGYHLVPRSSDVGQYDLTIRAGFSDKVYKEVTTKLIVVSASAGTGETAKVIVLGDSTSPWNGIGVKLHDNFESDAMNITLLGTRGTSPYNTEGRPGWSIYEYCHDAVDPGSSSVVNPFFNPTSEQFDADYYFTNTPMDKPDFFVISLGINDIHAIMSDKELSDKIPGIMDNLKHIVNSVLSATETEGTKVGVCITTPPNKSQDAFGRAGSQTRKRYKRNLVYWDKAIIQEFANREAERIYLVPIHTNLDTIYNMCAETRPVNARNSTMTYITSTGEGNVHPDITGYWQIADVYTAFIKGNA